MSFVYWYFFTLDLLLFRSSRSTEYSLIYVFYLAIQVLEFVVDGLIRAYPVNADTHFM